MVLDEKQILDELISDGKSECLLVNNTCLERRVCSAIFNKWKTWADASAHDAPPPDYFSDKRHMMFDVLAVFDSETEILKRPGKFRNEVLENERKLEHDAREFLKECGIDAAGMNVFCEEDADGFEYDAKHTYESYSRMTRRVIKKHTDKLSLYDENHPGYICGLLVCDFTEAYIEVDSLSDMQVEYGEIRFRRPHCPWLDRAFLCDVLNTDLRFIIWYMPYKKYSVRPGFIPYPSSVILDLKYPRLQSKLVDYSVDLMRPL